MNNSSLCFNTSLIGPHPSATSNLWGLFANNSLLALTLLPHFRNIITLRVFFCSIQQFKNLNSFLHTSVFILLYQLSLYFFSVHLNISNFPYGFYFNLALISIHLSSFMLCTLLSHSAISLYPILVFALPGCGYSTRIRVFKLFV